MAPNISRNEITRLNSVVGLDTKLTLRKEAKPSKVTSPHMIAIICLGKLQV